MKKIFTLLAFILVYKSLFSQIYSVPGAQVQPAWVFPLWFEDGSGAKDTLYFCYDADSQIGPPWDSIMGEIRVQMDTSKFNAFFDCSFTADFRTFKTSVEPSELNESICFWHAYMPIKIKWDRNLFYSDSLPFPNQLPAPYAEGALSFDLFTISLDPAPNCYSPIMMTDSVVLANCYATDSIVLSGELSILTFEIDPWDGKEFSGTGTYELVVNKNLEIYPSVVSTKFEIENNESDDYLYSVISMSGQFISQGIIPPYSKTEVFIQGWCDGLYLVHTINQINGQALTFKIIKPKS